MDQWRNKVAIVSGAGAGIGRSISITLAENNVKVVGVDKNLIALQNVANIIKGEFHFIKCDVTKEEDVISAVKWTREKLGGADILVNSAGIAPKCPLMDFNSEDFKALYDINVVGLSIMTREVLKSMKERKSDYGHIFHICSLAGQRNFNFPGLVAYSGTKHAVRVLTEGLRRELRDAGTKIRVTSISPGAVRTNLFDPSGTNTEFKETFFKEHPSLNPKDIAGALIYALGTPPHVQIHEITILPLGEMY